MDLIFILSVLTFCWIQSHSFFINFDWRSETNIVATKLFSSLFVVFPRILLKILHQNQLQLAEKHSQFRKKNPLNNISAFNDKSNKYGRDNDVTRWRFYINRYIFNRLFVIRNRDFDMISVRLISSKKVIVCSMFVCLMLNFAQFSSVRHIFFFAWYLLEF